MKEDQAGIGVVIRDDKGQVIAFLSHINALSLSVVEIKFLAAVRALDFALDIGIDLVILKGDSEIVITSLLLCPFLVI